MALLGQFRYLWASLLASHTLEHCVSPFYCGAYFCGEYGGRQLVLSGQLCPFISLPGTAVIKQNKETGSNSRVKEKKSLFRFVHFLFAAFPPPVSGSAASSGETEEADL